MADDSVDASREGSQHGDEEIRDDAGKQEEEQQEEEEEEEQQQQPEDDWEDPYPDYTLEDMEELVQQQGRTNSTVEQEMIMFEHYFATNCDSVEEVSGAGEDKLNNQRRRRSKKEKSAAAATGTQVEAPKSLTASQKHEIVLKELQRIKSEMEKNDAEAEESIATAKAAIDAIGTRKAELKKLEYDFHKDIIEGSVNPVTGKVVGERLLKYYEDVQRERETIVDKLGLKISGLKAERKKLLLQLKQKEEMGEVLHEVDFHQLKIENSQFVEQIAERNKELLKLKLASGNTLQVLNTFKKRLATLALESERLKKERLSRHAILAKIEKEIATVGKERETESQRKTILKTQKKEYRVPDVLDYVKEKAEAAELEKKVRTWEHKVAIAKSEVKKHRRKMRAQAQQQSGLQNYSATAGGNTRKSFGVTVDSIPLYK